jgi:hypothetical protein
MSEVESQKLPAISAGEALPEVSTLEIPESERAQPPSNTCPTVYGPSPVTLFYKSWMARRDIQKTARNALARACIKCEGHEE